MTIDIFDASYNSLAEEHAAMEKMSNLVNSLTMLKNSVRTNMEDGGLSVPSVMVVNATLESLFKQSNMGELSTAQVSTESMTGYNDVIVAMEVLGNVTDALGKAWQWLLEALATIGKKIKGYLDKFMNWIGNSEGKLKKEVETLKENEAKVDEKIKEEISNHSDSGANKLQMVSKIWHMSEYAKHFMVDGSSDPKATYTELNKYIKDLTSMYSNAMPKYSAALEKGNLTEVNDSIRKEFVEYMSKTKAIGSFRMSAQDQPYAILITREKEEAKNNIKFEDFTSKYLVDAGTAALEAYAECKKSINELNEIGLSFDKFKEAGEAAGLDKMMTSGNKLDLDGKNISIGNEFIKGLKESKSTIDAILTAISRYQERVGAAASVLTKILKDLNDEAIGKILKDVDDQSTGTANKKDTDTKPKDDNSSKDETKPKDDGSNKDDGSKSDPKDNDKK